MSCRMVKDPVVSTKSTPTSCGRAMVVVEDARARKKLLRRGGDLALESEVGQARKEALGETCSVARVKECAGEVVVGLVGSEHVVDGGEHGSGDSYDGLHGTPTALDAKKLSPKIGILGLRCAPGRLDYGGLEPGSALAQPRGTTLTSALVIAWTEARPRDEMSRTRETRHVDSNFRHDDVGDGVTDARNRRQELSPFSNRVECAPNPILDLLYSGVECIDLCQMEAQQEPMVLTYPPPEGFNQASSTCPEPSVCEFDQDHFRPR